MGRKTDFQRAYLNEKRSDGSGVCSDDKNSIGYVCHSADEISGIRYMSSVVPSITNTLKRAIEKLAGIDTIVIGPGIKTGLSIKIDNPAQLGSWIWSPMQSVPFRNIHCHRSLLIWEQQLLFL